MLMHRIDPDRHMARFYRLRFQPILWGGAALVREWGRIGRAGRVRDDHHADPFEATAAAARLERSKRRRGYVGLTGSD